MKRSDLKKILKPLIKECIKEVMFEEGVLSTVISEVIRGTQPVIRGHSPAHENIDSQREDKQKQLFLEQRQKEEFKRKRKLLDAAGFGGVDIFEGTEPLHESSTPSPLGDVSPVDPGVDISGIMGLGSPHWKKAMKG